MSSSLNVIALISGGKDSLYSILHCIQNGHNVVALANLHPTMAHVGSPNLSEDVTEVDDINSFMYQTVGHSIIPMYGQALQLPLFRRAISGTATQTGRYYNYARHGPFDETEDLIPLLKEVMQHHPEANAVCSGAILSTYQRTRIESVALRLGLTPLAYLWQYPALPPPLERQDSITGLLDDMEAAGCDSRIIKIASGGVKESMLWNDVALPRTRNQLVAAMAPFFQDHEFWFRGAVLGEGGEYETLAINGPPTVWKQRIEIDGTRNVVVQDEGGASRLRFGPGKTVNQDKNKSDNHSSLVRIPVLLDPEFKSTERELSSESSRPIPASQSLANDFAFMALSSRDCTQATKAPSAAVPCLRMTVSRTPTTITISNITTTECSGAAHKTRHIMQLLKTCIHSLKLEHQNAPALSENDIVFTTLLLSDISDFSVVNAEYCKAFTSYNPPARVTVACADILPDNVQVSLSVVLDTGPRERRRGLHVQSRSYWAPANIGPYSQAISVPLEDVDGAGGGGNVEVVHIAGQIPLVPHTMELLTNSFLQQTVLSLQHLWRIGQERDVDWWTHGIAYLATANKSDKLHWDRVQLAWETWRRANIAPLKQVNDAQNEDEEDGPDAWDLRHNPYHRRGFPSSSSSLPCKPSRTHLHRIPNSSIIQDRTFGSNAVSVAYVPPLIVAEVRSLPRSAPVEWHSLGLGSMPTINPRLRINMTRHSWGSASHCTVLAGTQAQDDDSDLGGDDADGQVPKMRCVAPPKTTDFVTIQIYDQCEAPPEDGETLGNILSATSFLKDIAGAGSDVDNCTIATWNIVQGTAYVSGKPGWGVLQTLRKAPGWDAWTIIPCHALWGAATDGHVHEVIPTRLTLAIVLRRELLKQPSP